MVLLSEPFGDITKMGMEWILLIFSQHSQECQISYSAQNHLAKQRIVPPQIASLLTTNGPIPEQLMVTSFSYILFSQRLI
jgi:hypothetical protein